MPEKYLPESVVPELSDSTKALPTEDQRDDQLATSIPTMPIHIESTEGQETTYEYNFDLRSKLDLDVSPPGVIGLCVSGLSATSNHSMQLTVSTVDSPATLAGAASDVVDCSKRNLSAGVTSLSASGAVTLWIYTAGLKRYLRIVIDCDDSDTGGSMDLYFGLIG